MMCAIGLMSCQKDKKPRNNVHFYVTRDNMESIIPNTLLLWIGKPTKLHGEWNDYSSTCACICTERRFVNYGLKPLDFKNLKWEDEPVEVFLNLED